MPVHPLDATALDQLGAQYLIDYKQARLLTPKILPAYDKNLAANLDSITDPDSLASAVRVQMMAFQLLEPAAAADTERALRALADARGESLAAWEQIALELLDSLVAGKPYMPAAPLELQISPGTSTLLAALVTLRRGREKLAGALSEIGLPAAPRPIAGRPPLGNGPIDVFECADMADVLAGKGHFAVREALAPVHDRLRWHLIYAPTSFRPKADYVAAAAELIARRLPGRYWDVIRSMYKHHLVVEVGQLSPVLQDLGLIYGGIEKEAEAFLRAGALDRDLEVANACAIPQNSPRYAIGTEIFIGTRRGPAMLAHIQSMLAAD